MFKSRFTYFVLLAVVIGFSSCKKWPWQDCFKGEGGVFEDKRSFGDYTSFTLDIPSEVYLHPDTNRVGGEVVIIAQRNVSEEIKITDNEGALSVSFDGCFREHEEITFHLYFNNLDELVINSPSRVFSEKALFSNKLNMVLNESASIDAFIVADKLSIDFNGAANMRATGTAAQQQVVFNSSAAYDAEFLISDSTYVTMDANASFKAYVTGLLDVTMSQGKVEYKGEDTLTVTDRLTGGLLLDQRDSL